MEHKKNHGLLMLLCCLIPIALIFIANYFGVGQKYLFVVFMLLCPLMHYFMMKDCHEKKH